MGSSESKSKKKTLNIGSSSEEVITIRGARQHNLKNVDLSIPRNKLVVFTGVSGTVSSYVAKLLSKLSNHRQVFCVTHQPLIAAFADNHFALKKTVIDGNTVSKLTYLKETADRQKELALLGGGEIVEASDYAASLLQHKAA